MPYVSTTRQRSSAERLSAPAKTMNSNAVPLYAVEEPGEWRMEVYDDVVVYVDFYEGFAEISFLVE